MHRIFNQIADPGDKRCQNDKIETRTYAVDFECPGYQQAQKYTVPDRMEIIEVEVFIINCYLARRDPV